MSDLMHRLLRASAFLAGIGLGLAAAIFAYSNQEHVAVHWLFLNLPDVAIGWVALLPLVVGVVAGYVYHLPARMHHVAEHMRHRHLVHQLQRENAELSQQLATAGTHLQSPAATPRVLEPELAVVAVAQPGSRPRREPGTKNGHPAPGRKGRAEPAPN